MAQAPWCSEVVSSTDDCASVASPRKPVGGCHNRRLSRTLSRTLSRSLSAPVATAAPSASMPEDVGHAGGSTSLASRLGSALRGVAALPRECVGDLRAAIGAPPRRPLEDPRAPSGLVWAADVAVALVALSVALFALAFVGNGCEGSEGPAAETLGSPDENAEVSGPLAKMARTLTLVILSSVAGAFLNTEHSLVPAVLCNI